MSQAALHFVRWRALSAQRDDCAKRLKAKGDKRTRKRLKTLKQLVDDKWRELGVELGGLSDEQFQAVLSHASEHSRLSSQPPVFGWQAEATRLVEIAYLLGGDDDKPTSLNGATVDLTARQLEKQVRTNGHNGFTLHDLRRFVRKVLGARLKSEQGKRN